MLWSTLLCTDTKVMFHSTRTTSNATRAGHVGPLGLIPPDYTAAHCREGIYIDRWNLPRDRGEDRVSYDFV